VRNNCIEWCHSRRRLSHLPPLLVALSTCLLPSFGNLHSSKFAPWPLANHAQHQHRRWWISLHSTTTDAAFTLPSSAMSTSGVAALFWSSARPPSRATQTSEYSDGEAGKASDRPLVPPVWWPWARLNWGSVRCRAQCTLFSIQDRSTKRWGFSVRAWQLPELWRTDSCAVDEVVENQWLTDINSTQPIALGHPTLLHYSQVSRGQLCTHWCGEISAAWPTIQGTPLLGQCALRGGSGRAGVCWWRRAVPPLVKTDLWPFPPAHAPRPSSPWGGGEGPRTAYRRAGGGGALGWLCKHRSAALHRRAPRGFQPPAPIGRTHRLQSRPRAYRQRVPAPRARPSRRPRRWATAVV